MNLTEAFNATLPELPTRSRELRPRTHPHLIGREHVEGGVRTVNCIIPEKGFLYRLSPEQWELVNLCDGTHTLEEIAKLHVEQTGVRYTVDDLREIVSTLDETEFWYKTPLEENIALKQRLSDQRRKQAKTRSKYGDVSDLRLAYWNPDQYLDTIYPRLKFLYSRWFAVVSLVAVVFTTYIFVTHWGEIGRDTLQFYNFREKDLWDVVEFWLLACFVLFIHESAHGLTCKHYGGHVYRMGFNLIYLSPAFFTDATEIFVIGGKWERLMTVFWGVWSELLLCAVVTPIWWGTPPGTFAHDISYKLMLITGVAVVFFNWNPLIKLDGYYLLTESLSLPLLKEESTSYVSGWVQKNIWRLPVEVPFIPRRRRLGYAIYALCSGVYSYTLLYYAAHFLSNIASSYSPDWGFLVGLAVGYRIFRSRIRTLVKFMKTVYLDKKERVRAWFTPLRAAVAGVVLLAALFTPLWRESVEGRFVLEPANRAVVRAAVPGTVTAVYAAEGQSVPAGAALASLRNLKLESEAAQAATDFRVASARAIRAQFQYADYAAAERQRQQLAVRDQTLSDQVARLQLTSPIAGTVVTPRVSDRLGSYLTAGTEVAEVADLTTMRARVYVPEFEVRKARLQAPVRLLMDSFFSPRAGVVASIAPAASEIAAGLMKESAYKGTRISNFYMYDIRLPNPDGKLRPGMAGTAQILGERRSLARLVAEPVYSFLGRKIW